MDNIQSILQQQIVYYQARSSEYDEWFLRQGRYDRGHEWNQLWFQEVDQVRNSLAHFKPEGKILELACGTGLWTQELLNYTQNITAVDAVSEVILLNQQRLQSSWVRYIQANIFSWQPDEQYDFVFFGFWLSHVPEQRFEQFWRIVKQALKPGGRFFFVDSRCEPTSTARDHSLGKVQTGTVKRLLNNGQEFEIVKIFYEPEQLNDRLSQLGFKVKVSETPHYFLFGYGGVDGETVRGGN